MDAELSRLKCAVFAAAAIVLVDGVTNVWTRFWIVAKRSFDPTACPIAT